jgi:hypothetical protein
VDPSGLKKNLRINEVEFASRYVILTEEEVEAARCRIESLMGASLAASISEFDEVLPPLAFAYGSTPQRSHCSPVGPRAEVHCVRATQAASFALSTPQLIGGVDRRRGRHIATSR